MTQYAQSNPTSFIMAEKASKFTVLPQEEFNGYLKKWREEQCDFSYNKLINHNIKLVVATVLRRVRIKENVDREDLFQAGMLGLIRAIELFNPNLGWTFSTYATNWIRQYATREQENIQANVRIPIHIQRELNQYFKAIRELPNGSRRPEDIYQWLLKNNPEQTYHAKFSTERIRSLLALNDVNQTQSLEAMADAYQSNASIDGDTGGYLDRINPLEEPTHSATEEKVSSNSLINLLESVLQNPDFSDKEIQVISYRFGLRGHETLTLEATGELIGLTRERIRQIQVNVLLKLRRRLKEKGFNDLENLLGT